MRRNLKNTGFALLIGLLFSSGFWISCKKTEPAEAVITVLDTLGKPVRGATVTLFQDSLTNQNTGIQANIIDVNVTDINGESLHTIDWEAVLNVEAVKGNQKARDFVRLEQSKTIYKTVRFK